MQVHEIVTCLERENFKFWTEKKPHPDIWELHMKTGILLKHNQQSNNTDMTCEGCVSTNKYKYFRRHLQYDHYIGYIFVGEKTAFSSSVT